METRKIILYVLVAMLGVTLYTQWQKDYPSGRVSAAATTASSKPTTAPGSTQKTTPDYSPASFTPSSPDVSSQKTPPVLAATQSNNTISVNTDVFNVKIDLNTGNLVQSSMKKYPESTELNSVPVEILNGNNEQLFVGQSGVTNADFSTPFRASQKVYQLQPGQNTLLVTLSNTTQKGLAITKTYTFTRSQYDIQLNQSVKNQGQQPWRGGFYQQISRRDVPSTTQQVRSFNGASISSPNQPYKKITYKDLSKEAINQTISQGWIAMQQPYFLAAWIPSTTEPLHYFSHVDRNNDSEHPVYIVGYVSSQQTLKSGASSSFLSRLYVGPEVASNLKPLAHGLDLTIDYGWLSPISRLIFSLMIYVHHIIGNWGWSIIAVTFLIKLLFYYPSAKSYQSMAKMRLVAPRMKALKERYADDREGLSKATMELYKKEKVNPAGSCLPMIIQIPVFFSLYYVLIESIQLRQAPFIFWIHDLSTMDPYYILPILMGLSMLAQQRLTPAPPDPTQAKMMMLMPVVFTLLFLHFPSGLVLYWLTNNVLSIAQQWYVTKTYKPGKDDWKKKK